MIVRDLVAQLLEMPQDADVRLSCYTRQRLRSVQLRNYSRDDAGNLAYFDTVVLSFKDLRAAPGGEGPLPGSGASAAGPKP